MVQCGYLLLGGIVRDWLVQYELTLSLPTVFLAGFSFGLSIFRIFRSFSSNGLYLEQY